MENKHETGEELEAILLREEDALENARSTGNVKETIAAIERVSRIERWLGRGGTGGWLPHAIELARSIQDLERVAELCWHVALSYHWTVDEGESMDAALEGMEAAQEAGSERWTIVCRAEALFDGLCGTYPRIATSLAWAPEAQTSETTIAAMREYADRLEHLQPEASWIVRAYLACLIQGNRQEELARIEWNRSLEQARAAGSRFAEEEILCLMKMDLWCED